MTADRPDKMHRTLDAALAREPHIRWVEQRDAIQRRIHAANPRCGFTEQACLTDPDDDGSECAVMAAAVMPELVELHANAAAYSLANTALREKYGYTHSTTLAFLIEQGWIGPLNPKWHPPKENAPMTMIMTPAALADSIGCPYGDVPRWPAGYRLQDKVNHIYYTHEMQRRRVRAVVEADVQWSGDPARTLSLMETTLGIAGDSRLNVKRVYDIEFVDDVTVQVP